MKFSAFQNQVVFDTMNKLFGAQLPVKVAYRLSKIQKVVGAESAKYQELRLATIMKFAERTEDDVAVVDEQGNAKLREGTMDDLIAEMNDLHSIEFDLGGQVTLDEIDRLNLSSYDLAILDEIGMLNTAETE